VTTPYVALGFANGHYELNIYTCTSPVSNASECYYTDLEWWPASVEPLTKKLKNKVLAVDRD